VAQLDRQAIATLRRQLRDAYEHCLDAETAHRRAGDGMAARYSTSNRSNFSERQIRRFCPETGFTLSAGFGAKRALAKS
jgi:hypothetical protein